MKFLIAYATSEGQTRKIARHIADRVTDAGHTVELMRCDDAHGSDLERFDGVILAGSIHANRYQKKIVRFADRASRKLNARPTLFLSVSLAAAGHDADEWRSLDEIANDFVDATGFEPDRVLHVAGAYKPSDYDILRRLVMRRIIAVKDPDADPDQDREYTDWQALDDAVADWLSGLTRAAA